MSMVFLPSPVYSLKSPEGFFSSVESSESEDALLLEDEEMLELIAAGYALLVL